MVSALATLLAAASALTLAAPASAAWQPERARYGVGQLTSEIQSSDGKLLHVAVSFPTDPKTGQEAAGRFPVLLTQTPYGSSFDQFGTAGTVAAAALVGRNPYMVQRGYIYVEMDVRGTGASQGVFGLFDPIQGRDGALAVRWAARLPHSSGVVGLVGASYLGIDQFATAADAGRGSPVKAMFPVISSNELYRDEVTAGGVPSLEFNLPYIAGLIPGLGIVNPVFEGGPTALSALVDHLEGVLTSQVPQILDVVAGGTQSFDGPYWQVRSPVTYVRQIVADKIPAFLIGGWFDLFQRGEPLNYAAFQNAYRHRPLLAPMRPHQAVTGRYQLVDGPYFHVTAGAATYRGLDLNELELAWFDRWLKDIHTGIDQTSTPMHLFDLGARSWRNVARYPLDQAKPTTFYFHAGNALSAVRPTATRGSDPIVFYGASLPCSTSIEQWGAGLGALLWGSLKTDDPCTQDASLSEQGPGAVNYTTEPFKRPTTLAGPIGATIYATANTKETLWVVSIADVAPNGAARQLTQGVLAGSMRAEDPSSSWMGTGGRPILPYHAYTQSAYSPVVPGQLTRYDVEVFPTSDTLEPGHRLRVTVATDDFPHVFPNAQQFPNLIGGVYQVDRSAAASSGVELPLSTR